MMMMTETPVDATAAPQKKLHNQKRPKQRPNLGGLFRKVAKRSSSVSRLFNIDDFDASGNTFLLESSEHSAVEKDDKDLDSVPHNHIAAEVVEEGPSLTIAGAEENQVSSERRVVQFSTVELRSYPICAGDNPSVSKGVAITIEWEHDSVWTLPLEEYEDVRPFPRSLTQLRMTSNQRTDRLRTMGYSRSEIQEWVQRGDRLRKQRMQTTKFLALAPMEEYLEGIRRSALNATIRRSAKRKEKQFLYSSAH
jgi:hypothetical protein